MKAPDVGESKPVALVQEVSYDLSGVISSITRWVILTGHIIPDGIIIIKSVKK